MIDAVNLKNCAAASRRANQRFGTVTIFLVHYVFILAGERAAAAGAVGSVLVVFGHAGINLNKAAKLPPHKSQLKNN